MISTLAYEKMAKLDLPDSEREQIQKALEKLAISFDKLADIETEGIMPMFTVLPMTNVLREDISKKPFTREEILQNAPEQYDGYFQVPKTIE